MPIYSWFNKISLYASFELNKREYKVIAKSNLWAFRSATIYQGNYIYLKSPLIQARALTVKAHNCDWIFNIQFNDEGISKMTISREN